MKKFLFRKSMVAGAILLFFGMSIALSTAGMIENEYDITDNKIPGITLGPRGITLYVGGDGPGNYSKIQDAIENASDGDTVFVYNGTYTENLIVNKTINLFGEDKDITIIQGNRTGDVVSISATLVNISGFTIQESEISYYYAGIETNSSYTTINNNNILNIGNGVYITSSSNNIISNNTFTNSGLIVPTTGPYQNTVLNNTVNGKALIYLDEESDLVIEEAAGQIILMDCNNITILNQDISHTGIGIQMIESNECTISNNDIYSNYICGIQMIDSDNCIISENDIYSNNDCAIQMMNIDNCMISDNNIYSNYFALLLEFTSLNTFKRNNFGNNFVHVVSIFGSLNNWNGNYWNRPRIFPKLILEIPRINFDWNPANQPY